jgi:hypothetical protein
VWNRFLGIQRQAHKHIGVSVSLHRSPFGCGFIVYGKEAKDSLLEFSQGTFSCRIDVLGLDRVI